jgi:hypothetical protein
VPGPPCHWGTYRRTWASRLRKQIINGNSEGKCACGLAESASEGSFASDDECSFAARLNATTEGAVRSVSRPTSVQQGHVFSAPEAGTALKGPTALGRISVDQDRQTSSICRHHNINAAKEDKISQTAFCT